MPSIQCPMCYGSGAIKDTKIVKGRRVVIGIITCPLCEGKGKLSKKKA